MVGHPVPRAPIGFTSPMAHGILPRLRSWRGTIPGRLITSGDPVPSPFRSVHVKRHPAPKAEVMSRRDSVALESGSGEEISSHLSSSSRTQIQ